MIISEQYAHSIDAILHGTDNQHCGNSNPSSRRRRTRTVFSASAIRRMEEEFELNRYPDIRQRETIAADIGVSEARIQVWFQNRRARNNKRRKPSDRFPDVGNVCKRQRVEPTEENHASEACLERRLPPVASKPETSQRASSICHGVHTLPFPIYPYIYYNGFASSSLQTPSQLQILASRRQETKTKDDTADDIVKRLFRFSSSDSRPTSAAQPEADSREQKQIYRMVVPTKKATDCSVTELRSSDSARVEREEVSACTLDEEDSRPAND